MGSKPDAKVSDTKAADAKSPDPRPADAKASASSRAPDPAPAPARSSPGFGRLLAAALLGGGVGAGAMIAAQSLLPRDTGGGASSDLEQRLASLEQRGGAFASRDALQALEGRVTGLAKEVDGLKAGVSSAQDLARRAAEAQRPAAAPAAPAPGGAAPVPAAPTPATPTPSAPAPTAAAPTAPAQSNPAAPTAAAPSGAPAEPATPARPAVAAAPAGPTTEAFGQLAGRVSTLEAQVKENADAARKQAADAVREALDRAQGAATAAQAATSAVQGVERRVAEIDGRVGDQGKRLDETARRAEDNGKRAEDNAKRVDDLDQRLAALAKQVETVGSDTLARSLGVVLSDRVGAALDEGTPYADTLVALRQLKVEPEALGALEPFAATGAPTGEALARDFAPVAERARDAARPPGEGLADRLQRMASRVVEIRPVDDPSAGGADGAAARVEEALRRGAFGEALAAWKALPEPARAQAQEFERRLTQRAAADEAARRLQAGALKALQTAAR